MKYGKIKITTHARQRLKERMPEINPSNYNQVVQAARYKGLTRSDLEKNYPRLAKYIKQRFRYNNSTEIRVYKNCVFIFCGDNHHSRSLRTVVDIHESYRVAV